MKTNCFAGRYPDWRRDGARNDEVAGAERLPKMEKQSRHVADDVNQLASQGFEIGSVSQFRTVANDAPAQPRQRATRIRGFAAA